MTAIPRLTGDRNKRLFESARAVRGASERHAHLAKEITSKDYDRAPCIFVSSYRALIRVVGYLKYNTETSVLLRGQVRCHRTMKASLHRRAVPPSDMQVESFLKRYRSQLGADLTPVAQLSTEPLLQHYGVETRWLDVVDSVPHALFFATHTLVQSHSRPQAWTYVHSREPYGFLYVIDTGHVQTVRRRGNRVVGLTRGSGGLLIADLRKLKPSLALRPHAQHGLLIRDTSGNSDIWSRLVGRIAVPTAAARRWISSVAFDPEELFPPRSWDGVFGHLVSPSMTAFLKAESVAGRKWGEIQRFDFHDD